MARFGTTTTGTARRAARPPCSADRVVYRRRLKQHLVRAANRLALAGMALMLLSLVSAVLLVMDVVLGLVPAIVLASAMLVWFAAWWFAVPLVSRHRNQVGELAAGAHTPADGVPVGGVPVGEPGAGG